MKISSGEKVNVEIELPSDSFEFYDRMDDKMKIAYGNYEIFYGNSSDAKNLKNKIVSVQYFLLNKKMIYKLNTCNR